MRFNETVVEINMDNKNQRGTAAERISKTPTMSTAHKEKPSHEFIRQ